MFDVTEKCVSCWRLYEVWWVSCVCEMISVLFLNFVQLPLVGYKTVISYVKLN